jgi:hypothetical protein
LTFDFLWFFLSNLIIILLIPIYFAFNIFSNWILFFDFIHNHFILILFFVELDPHFYDWNSFLFGILFMIDCFFCNFIHRCLISLSFHIIFDVYFFLLCF